MQGAGVQGPLWEVQSLQAVRRGTGAVKGLQTSPRGLDLCDKAARLGVTAVAAC